jgi:hypothetical protein
LFLFGHVRSVFQSFQMYTRFPFLAKTGFS